MIKYLCALSILFSGFSFSAENNNDIGIYRDNNYNISALSGDYSCGVYSLPDDLINSEGYKTVKLGEAKLNVRMSKDNNVANISITFDSGKRTPDQSINVISKTPDITTYGAESNGSFLGYIVNAKGGVKVLLQDKTKGKEVSIALGDCWFNKKSN